MRTVLPILVTRQTNNRAPLPEPLHNDEETTIDTRGVQSSMRDDDAHNNTNK